MREAGGQGSGAGQIQFNFEDRPLTDQELTLWNFLQGHRGRAAAVQADRLAGMLGMEERRLRMTIKHLVEDHAFLIGSSTVKPCGYFIPVSEDEIDQVTGQLMHRLKSLALRISRLKKISVEQIFHQLRLEEIE